MNDATPELIKSSMAQKTKLLSANGQIKNTIMLYFTHKPSRNTPMLDNPVGTTDLLTHK